MKPMLFVLLLVITLGGAVYWLNSHPSNLQTKIALVTPLPTSAPSLENQIKSAVAQKHNLQISQITITVSSQTDAYAKGMVNIEGEGGGIFLAALDGATWKLVADGNGIVTCQEILPYKFPQSMVPACVDQNGQLINQ